MVGDKVYVVVSEMLDGYNRICGDIECVFISKDAAKKYIENTWKDVGYSCDPWVSAYWYYNDDRIKICRHIEEHTIQGGENEK